MEQAQLRVAAELPNVYYIDMSDAGLLPDGLHFDSAWTEYLGKKMYNKLVELKLADGAPVEVEKPRDTVAGPGNRDGGKPAAALPARRRGEAAAGRP